MKRRTNAAKAFGIGFGIATASLSLLLAQNTLWGAALSQRELAGKKLFLQRCSICHFAPLPGAPRIAAFGGDKPIGPLLNGYVEGPETEARAREIIRKGTPQMPGFQYGLNSEEIDELIAYMKTMR